MIVEVDVKSLTKDKISANQFIILFLFHSKKYNILTNFIKKTHCIKDLVTVIQDGYIEDQQVFKVDEETDIIQVRYDLLVPTDKLKTYIEGEIDLFDELWEAYPLKTDRTDFSTDYLRTDKKECRALYSRITKGQKHIHENILQALQKQLSIFNSHPGKMCYMRRLKNWLQKEEWKTYEGDDNPKTNYAKPTLGYGQQLL